MGFLGMRQSAPCNKPALAVPGDMVASSRLALARYRRVLRLAITRAAAARDELAQATQHPRTGAHHAATLATTFAIELSSLEQCSR